MLTVLMSILLVLTVINSFYSKKDKFHKNEVASLHNEISGLKGELKTTSDSLDVYKTFNKKSTQ